ncbi:hypothetical protein UlMin_027792 [Ulmus minor]
MSGFDFNEQYVSILRLILDAPPTHYTLKIQSFSLLNKNTIDKFESAAFEAGGYEWKLVIYPNENKRKNVKENISVYLAMAAAESLQKRWEVHAVLRLFLLDQNNDNYMVLQDVMGKERQFHRMKLEWGFDEFIPLKTFNNCANGFLVDDTCVFGVEVFVCKERGREKRECFQMMKDPILNKHSWKIKLYPNGKGAGLGTCVFLYLALEALLPPPKYMQTTNWFSASDKENGWSRFRTTSYFSHTDMGYLLKDTCIIEAEVTVHRVYTPI